MKNLSVWSRKNSASIVDAYHRWHKDCVYYIFSDFSFVIYDSINKSYFAARDAVGTRPLYYTTYNNKFHYSDNIGELFTQSNIQKEPDIDALAMLMHYSSIDYSDTLYKDIKRLPPGHYMTVNQDGEIEIVRYWKPEEIKINRTITEDEAKERFLELFKGAIDGCIDDISTTSFELSGGLDSSSIVSMAKQMYPKNDINTISMSFGTLSRCDESEYIDSMQAKYDLGINKVNIDKLDYENKYSLESNYNLDPYWPILLTYTMKFPPAEQLNDMNIKRVLTGQGGDEILGGNAYCIYDYFIHFQWLKVYRELKVLKRPIDMMKQYIISPLLGEKQKKFIRGILQLMRFEKVNKNKKKSVFKKSLQELSERFTRESLAFWYDAGGLVSTRQSMILDISSYHVVEKHYGITFSHPFFDRRLIEFMLSLPAKFKYKEGVSKVLLRKAMKGILPEKIRQRKDKAEFTAVVRQQIDAIDLDELLDNAILAKLDLIEQSSIDQLKEEYISGKMKTVVYFWKIINMEYWYRYNFVNNHEKA